MPTDASDPTVLYCAYYSVNPGCAKLDQCAPYFSLEHCRWECHYVSVSCRFGVSQSQQLARQIMSVHLTSWLWISNLLCNVQLLGVSLAWRSRTDRGVCLELDLLIMSSTSCPNLMSGPAKPIWQTLHHVDPWPSSIDNPCSAYTWFGRKFPLRHVFMAHW